MSKSFVDLSPSDQVALRYPFITPTLSLYTTNETDDTAEVELQDGAINQVTLGSGIAYATVTFPPKAQGVARDFFLRLTLTGETPPTISFREADDTAVAFDLDDDAWAEIEPGVNVIMFSDTSEGSAA